MSSPRSEIRPLKFSGFWMCAWNVPSRDHLYTVEDKLELKVSFEIRTVSDSMHASSKSRKRVSLPANRCE
jgi:hypothetical protein